MIHILANLTGVFLLPFGLGMLFRYESRDMRAPWLVTVMAALASVVGLVVELHLFTEGSAMAGMIFLNVASFTVGSLVMGLILRGGRSRAF